MIAAKFEYLFLLLIWAAAGISILWPRLRVITRSRHFWLSSALFVALGAAVDWIAISHAWWQWSPSRTCGVRIVLIPIEEYIGFFIGHLLTVGAWETLNELA